jgi:hypothetical protein
MKRRDFLAGSVATSAALWGAGLNASSGQKAETAASQEEKQPVKSSNERWIRPAADAKRLIWGVRDGIQVGLWPASVEGSGDGGPRGLLRIGYPILDDGKRAGLINFIAVEPIVKGKRGYSELERSAMDQKQGRAFWTGSPSADRASVDPGVIRTVDGVERLSVRVYVESFTNGAVPVVDLEMRADRPGELHLTVSSAPGTAVIEKCILTATMGNYGRLRNLWLRDGAAHARDVWKNFAGAEFTKDAHFAFDRMVHLPGDDLIVCATTDELDPHAVPPDPAGPGWAYRGSFPVTQYWRVPKDACGAQDVKVRVNGRRLYWATHNPIPGGIAYENFDLEQPFCEGQSCIFGLTRLTPKDFAQGLLP